MVFAASPVRYVDTHAHLDDPAFDEDRDEVIAAANAAGVSTIVNVGYCPARWRTTTALADRHRSIAPALGVHPYHADEFTPRVCKELANAISNVRAVAVGEIGLDYFRNGPDEAIQRRAFEAQLDLARTLDRPIIVHQRAAEDDLMQILTRFDPLPPLVLHSFEGTQRLAALANDRRFFVGVGGLATRPSSEALRRILATVPSDTVVLETDSPYLTPTGIPGRRNDPRSLPTIAETLGPLWGLSTHEFAMRTTRTAARLFGVGGAETVTTEAGAPTR